MRFSALVVAFLALLAGVLATAWVLLDRRKSRAWARIAADRRLEYADGPEEGPRLSGTLHGHPVEVHLVRRDVAGSPLVHTRVRLRGAARPVWAASRLFPAPPGLPASAVPVPLPSPGPGRLWSAWTGSPGEPAAALLASAGLSGLPAGAVLYPDRGDLVLDLPGVVARARHLGAALSLLSTLAPPGASRGTA